MGTTVTTNLGLIKPDQAESIKANLPTFAGWPVQQAANMDAIDALFRHEATGTWNPSISTDSTPQPTIGSGGFQEGKFVRLWPRMVLAWFRINFGTTGFVSGTGLYRIALPVAACAEFAQMEFLATMGKAALYDASTIATCSTLSCVYNNSNSLMQFHKADGDYFRQNTPITIAQSDVISGYFMYPTSVA